MKTKESKGELYLLKTLKDGSVIKYRFVNSDLNQLKNLKLTQKSIETLLKNSAF